MNRTSFWLAALVAAALFPIASSDARAQTEAAGQASPATGASLPDPSSEATPQGGGGATTTSLESPAVPAAQDSPTAPTPPAQEGLQPTTLSTGSPPGTAPSGQQKDPASPPAPGPAGGGPPTQRLGNEAPSAAAEPAVQPASAVAAPASPSVPATPAAPAAPVTRPVSPPAPVAPAGVRATASNVPGRPGDGLEQLLSEVGRRLHAVQGKIDDLRHRISHGAPPPRSRLVDLHTRLVRIAPMLAALEATVDTAGRLSPHLSRLLHSVGSDLRAARVTAGGLIAALRRAGARGREVRLIVKDLEQFRSFELALPSNLSAEPAPIPPPVAATRGFAAAQPTPAAYPPAPSMSPERGPAAPRRNGGSREDRRAQAPMPSPWSSALGAASAAPGGGVFFAAVASLTMLLIALVLPAIRARLDLPPEGRYTVAFLRPLERPG